MEKGDTNQEVRQPSRRRNDELWQEAADASRAQLQRQIKNKKEAPYHHSKSNHEEGENTRTLYRPLKKYSKLGESSTDGDVEIQSFLEAIPNLT